MGGGQDDPRAWFAERLRKLWEAAGRPDLNAVAAEAGLRSRQGRAAGGLISAWKNGDHVPDRWERLQPVLAALTTRARRRRGAGHSPRPDSHRGGEPDWETWKQWWSRARTSARDTAPAGSPDASPEPGHEGHRLSDTVLALLRQQCLDAESLPYLLQEGRLPKLSDIHVRQSLDAVPDDADERTPGRADTAGESGGTVPPQPPRRIEAVLADSPFEHLLVVAGPGGGKSTLTLRLAGSLARTWLAPHPPPHTPIPLMVTAASLLHDAASGPEALLVRTAHELMSTGTTAPVTRSGPVCSIPAHTGWLLLVDGVDEIADTTARRALVARLTALATRDEAPVRFLVTTRSLPGGETASLRQAGFGQYALEPFGEGDVEEFATRWFGDDASGRGRAAAYVRQAGWPGIRELVRVPLLATITAVIFEATPDRPLPSNRYHLYEQYRAYLSESKELRCLDHWQSLLRAADRHAASGQRSGLENARALRNEMLYDLAVEQTSGDGADLLGAALRRLERRLGPRPTTSVPGWSDKVAAALSSTGLITVRGRTARFLHASFAEHLAAEYHATRLPADFDPCDATWTWVVQHARGQEVPYGALLHFLHHRPAAGVDLLDWLQRDGNPHQCLAGRLLADGAPADTRHYERFLTTRPSRGTGACDQWWDWAALMHHPAVERFLNRTARAPGPDRMRAASALATHRPGQAATALREILTDPGVERSLRARAVMLFGSLGPDYATESGPALRELITDRVMAHEYERAASALQHYAGLGPDHAAQAAHALREVMTDRRRDDQVRRWAFGAYAGLGRVYRDEAMEALREMIAGPRERIVSRPDARKYLALLEREPESARFLYCYFADDDGS